MKVLEMDKTTLLADKLITSAKPGPGFAEAAEKAIAELREPDRSVLLRRLNGETLAQIAEQLGVSRERVRQYEARALRRLRRLVRLVERPEPPPPPEPLSVEDIEAILDQAVRERTTAWAEFMDSLTPAQREIWNRYWRSVRAVRQGKASPGPREVMTTFRQSLTPEQRELWRAYRRAGAYVARARTALAAARAGKAVYHV